MSFPRNFAASGLLTTGGTVLRGWLIRETSGSSNALVRLWDSTSASGTVLATIKLAAAGVSQAPETLGMGVDVGIYAEVVAGQVQGLVYFGKDPS
jgi:hypothetical protein